MNMMCCMYVTLFLYLFSFHVWTSSLIPSH